MAALAATASVAGMALAGTAVPARLGLARVTATTLTVTWRAAGTFRLRYRPASGGTWRVRRPRHGRSRYVLRHLRPATGYVVELGACARRCRWSAPLWARTAGPVVGGAPGAGTGGCRLLPADNTLHRDISADPLDPRSGAYVAAIGAGLDLHPDFGSNPAYGIPYAVVPVDQPRVPIHFDAYPRESDPGPYPIPRDAPVEGAGQSGDRHVLVVQSGACRLYELYNARLEAGGGWTAGSGAAWDLNSNALRPAGWTSADAAGLPILPLLVRYDEVKAGLIDHAIRFTVLRTQAAYIRPASHYASSSRDPNLPPMGLRLRLRATFDISGYPPDDRVILVAMKRFGLIVADNGSNWFFQGASDPRWNDDDLNRLKDVPGSAFEVVRAAG